MRKKHPNLRHRTFFTPLLMPVLGGVAVLLILAWVTTSLASTTVILVRHAEKAALPEEDPGLSDAGRARAMVLAELFADAGIEALYASEYRRTAETLEPLAERIGVEIAVIPARDPERLIESVLSGHRGGTVLIAGHSNTLPDLVTRLSGQDVAEIDESDYRNIFIVTVPRVGEAAVLRVAFPDASSR